MDTAAGSHLGQKYVYFKGKSADGEIFEDCEFQSESKASIRRSYNFKTQNTHSKVV